jgi:hypothetical protein
MATRHYTFEIPLDAGDVSGLTPAFSVFKNRVTGSNVTPQPTIVDLGANFYGFAHDDETLIFWRIDMGDSVDDAYRYPSGVIGSGEQYVRNADIPSSTLLLADDYTAPDNEGILAALGAVPTTTDLTAAIAPLALENSVAAVASLIDLRPTEDDLATALSPLALEETIASIPAATNTLLGNIHGTGPWGPTDAATGANDVSIRYIDDNDLPIEDVLVLIRASDDITRKEEKQTDSDGYINTRLDNGLYKIRPFKPQHSFTMPQELTVNGTTIVVYRGHYISPSTPTPGMQTLYGNLGNWISGEFDNVEITIAGKEKNQIVGGLIMTTAPSKITFTPSGYFEAGVTIGVREQIIIKHNGHIVYDKTILITPDATKDLATY